MLSIPTISLYQQTQKEVVPIIDYIPAIERGNQPPKSEIWKLKEVLDESQIRVVDPNTNQQQYKDQVNYLKAQIRLADCTKRTTSIMRNSSNRSIPNENNQNKQRPILVNERWKTQNSSKESGKILYNQYSLKKCLNIPPNRPNHLKERESTFKAENRSIQIKRSLLLKDIDNNFRVGCESTFEMNQIVKFRLQKKRLLSLINKKLEINKNIAHSLHGSVASKSTAKENNIKISTNEQTSNFVRKDNKLIGIKNALKQAALDSSKRSIVSSKQDKEEIKSNLSMIKGTTEEKHQQQVQQQFILTALNTGQFHQNEQQQTSQQQQMDTFKHFHKDQIKQEGVFTFSDINGISTIPFTFLHKHQKNISIEVEENDFKDISQTKTLPIRQENCVICKVIGKKCSFH